MKLRLVGPESQVVELDITAEVKTVGRAADCALTIPDQTVSRQHFSIRLAKSGEVIILDGQSRYGTLINDEQVPEDEVVLRPGEELVVGGWRGSVFDGTLPDISDNPTVDMELTTVQTPASTRKTRLLKAQKSRRSNGYLVLLFALAALGGVLLAYVLMDAL